MKKEVKFSLCKTYSFLGVVWIGIIFLIIWVFGFGETRLPISVSTISDGTVFIICTLGAIYLATLFLATALFYCFNRQWPWRKS